MSHLRVLGCVLAAGGSRRMGRPKALLQCGPDGETFVERTVRTLRAGGVDEVIVIGRPEDATLRTAVAELSTRARFVENPAHDMGQLSSVLMAVGEAERSRADGLLVMPVDMPLVLASSVAAAVRAFAFSTAPVVRVVHAGLHGHPVVFRSSTFGDFRRADAGLGAKSVVRAHASAVLDVEVDDPGVLTDLDLPGEYRSAFGHDPL